MLGGQGEANMLSPCLARGLAGAPCELYTFTVDAALIQELGERLIGQPQIALAELVKNSFDADASTCRIIFSEDKIEINDDGHGMSFQEFRWTSRGRGERGRRAPSPGAVVLQPSAADRSGTGI